MTESRTLERLRGYLAILTGVAERYVRDRNGYHPADGDVQVINQAALELVDLFRDRTSTVQYAKMVQSAYSDGVNNMSRLPSLSCVRDLATIVRAAITRITEHPEILSASNIVDSAPLSPSRYVTEQGVDKKFQVFISSTYTDMKVERQAAVMGILDAGHIPAGMELFAASDKKQIEVIHKWIDDSDIFMLILGGRYGSIDPDSGKSYIHLEYDYALARGKPFFALYLSDEAIQKKARGELGLSSIEQNDTKKLNEFRSAIKSKLCSEIEDLKDIHIQVQKSIRNLSENYNLEGWVRAHREPSGKDAASQLTTLDPKIEIVTGSTPPYNVEEDQHGHRLNTVRIGIRNAGGKTLSNCKVYVEHVTPPSDSGTDRRLLQGSGFRLRHDDSEELVDIASQWDHMDKFKFSTPVSGGAFVQPYDMKGNGTYTFTVRVNATECERLAKFELEADELKTLSLKFLGYVD